MNLGRAFAALRDGDMDAFYSAIGAARQEIIRGLSHSGTGTLGQCHLSMLKLHVLSEVELITGALKKGDFNSPNTRESFNTNFQRRLDILGASAKDREYVLALRRATFQLSKYADISSATMS